MPLGQSAGTEDEGEAGWVARTAFQCTITPERNSELEIRFAARRVARNDCSSLLLSIAARHQRKRRIDCMRNFRSAAVSACLMILGSLSMQAQVTGSGTKNYVPIWATSSSLGDSKLYQTGGNVGVGTTSPAHPLDVSGAINTSTTFNIGVPVLSVPAGGENLAVGLYSMSANTTGGFNLAAGFDALLSNTTGSNNAAVGAQALQHNTTGNYNTALGAGAMLTNVSGGYNVAVGNTALSANTASYNTAIGMSSMALNQSGTDNAAVGYDALENNVSGSDNVAVGAAALQVGTGVNNTAVGYGALGRVTTGYGNIGLGVGAGQQITGGGANNIAIGSPGVSTDTGVIRIGSSGDQTSFFAMGIRGVTTGASNAVAVLIDSNGQLGTVSSSIRFKQDVHDMADASSRLLQLRPVTYRYKQPYADGSQPIDYGLIAEEVAQVYPDLVATGADGQPETVQYQKLTPMLLNELQKQAETIRMLERRLAALEAK
jgi:hypothetical protein